VKNGFLAELTIEQRSALQSGYTILAEAERIRGYGYVKSKPRDFEAFYKQVCESWRTIQVNDFRPFLAASGRDRKYGLSE